MTANGSRRASAFLIPVFFLACGDDEKERTTAPADDAASDVAATVGEDVAKDVEPSDPGPPPSDIGPDTPDPGAPPPDAAWPDVADAAPDVDAPPPSCGTWDQAAADAAGPGDDDFPWGFASAEIRETSSRVWTATGGPATVIVHWSAGPTCPELSISAKATADTGYTAEIALTDLTPWTLYRFRLELEGGAGLTRPGWFVTMPVTDEPFRVALSGDITMDDSLYDIFDDVLASGSLLYIHQGDWPYADSAPAAVTLASYRGKHAGARAFPELHELFRFLPMNGNWDDHEVKNDWDGADLKADPDRVAAGMQAWKEWFPAVGDKAGEVYRKYRFGPGVEAFQLDCRSHRSANSAPNDNQKTMLGDDQLAWLLAGLTESTATFKLVLTSIPLDYGTTGNDHWPGFIEERETILEHIQNEQIPGVVFLAADQHWLAVHHMPHGPKEFQTGPIAGFTRKPLANPPPEVLLQDEVQNFGTLDYEPGPPATLTFIGWGEGGDVLYTETIPTGVGSIEVAPSLAGAVWSIDGAHVFTGKGPASLPWATPGTYTITWQSGAGTKPPPPQTLTLEDGATITFAADFEVVVPIFTEAFDGGALSPTWTVVEQGAADPSSSWKVTAGSAVETGNCFDVKKEEGVVPKLGTFLWAKSATFGEGAFEAQTYAGDDDGWGLMYGIQDAKTYYRFSMDHERSFARLVRDDGGDFTVLAEDLSFVPKLGAWTTITVLRTGSQHDVYVDGELILSAEDSTYPGGSIGLYAWGMDDVRFDDVGIFP